MYSQGHGGLPPRATQTPGVSRESRARASSGILRSPPVEVRSAADRFAVRALGHEQIVTGFEEAQQAAHALAERLK